MYFRVVLHASPLPTRLCAGEDKKQNFNFVLNHLLHYLLLLEVGVSVQVRAADRDDLSHAIVPLPN